MVEQRRVKAAMVVLAAGSLFHLFTGIMAGLHEDWMRMTLALFVSVLFFFYLAIGLLWMRLDNRLIRLEDRFQIDRKPVSTVVRRIDAVGIFMVFSVASQMVLSIVAGFRGDWFRLGIYLTACAITVIVCAGVSTVMCINARLARLEQFFAGTRKVKNA